MKAYLKNFACIERRRLRVGHNSSAFLVHKASLVSKDRWNKLQAASFELQDAMWCNAMQREKQLTMHLCRANEASNGPFEYHEQEEQTMQHLYCVCKPLNYGCNCNCNCDRNNTVGNGQRHKRQCLARVAKVCPSNQIWASLLLNSRFRN